MRTFFQKITGLCIRWYYWTLDYLYIGWWQVLGSLRRGDATMYLRPPANSSRRPPVILIPGIYEHWEFMRPVATALHRAGYAVHVIEGLGYNLGSVEAMAQKIEAYARRRQLKGCLIVAHSKGGLIGKYLLAHHNAHERFAGMVALNTPFSGSVYAYLLPLAGLRIFTPRSPILRLLAKTSAVNGRIVSIFGVFDPHIPGGSSLAGATNIQLPVYGHFRTINDPRVHAHILKGLDKLQRRQDEK